MAVLYFRNKGYKPVDAPRLRETLRTLLGSSNTSINVRVSPKYVEVSASGVELDTLVEASSKLLGEPPIEASGSSEGLSSYTHLIREEKYWEAHEALEAVWSRNRDKGLQTLILAAAALAKAQEGNPRGALKILERLKKIQDELGEAIVDIECVRRKIEVVFNGGEGRLEECIRLE